MVIRNLYRGKVCRIRIQTRTRIPYLENPYEDIDREAEEREGFEIIDDALYQYYVVENDLPVPNWRYIKDQDWWLEYLDSMGIDRRNP